MLVLMPVLLFARGAGGMARSGWRWRIRDRERGLDPSFDGMFGVWGGWMCVTARAV